MQLSYEINEKHVITIEFDKYIDDIEKIKNNIKNDNKKNEAFLNMANKIFKNEIKKINKKLSTINTNKIINYIYKDIQQISIILDILKKHKVTAFHEYFHFFGHFDNSTWFIDDKKNINLLSNIENKIEINEVVGSYYAFSTYIVDASNIYLDKIFYCEIKRDPEKKEQKIKITYYDKKFEKYIQIVKEYFKKENRNTEFTFNLLKTNEKKFFSNIKTLGNLVDNLYELEDILLDLFNSPNKNNSEKNKLNFIKNT